MRTEPKRLLGVVLAGAALAGCSMTSFDPWGSEATVVISWSIEGEPADEDLCAEAGAERVRMAINDEPIDWFDSRLEWPCAAGGTYLDSTFREGDFHVRFDLVDESGGVIAATHFRRVQLVEGVNEIEDVSFETH
jgi:hypothetical protein